MCLVSGDDVVPSRTRVPHWLGIRACGEISEYQLVVNSSRQNCPSILHGPGVATPHTSASTYRSRSRQKNKTEELDDLCVTESDVTDDEDSAPVPKRPSQLAL
eukprot:6298148-Amphidinium_carterae.1